MRKTKGEISLSFAPFLCTAAGSVGGRADAVEGSNQRGFRPQQEIFQETKAAVTLA